MSQSALSKTASLSVQPLDAFDAQSNETAGSAPAWKQEVNQRLAAHRNRRGGSQEGVATGATESPRAASARAAEAAARVAARYAKAPSYSQLLAGEARAVVRAAGAAAEAARNAQAAAEAVLAGLESGPMVSGLWKPAEERDALMARSPVAAPPVVAAQVAAPSRWQDEPPASAALAAYVPAAESKWAGAQPRWEEALPVTAAAPTGRAADRDMWSEMRVHPSPYTGNEDEDGFGRGQIQEGDEGELFPADSFDSYDATVEPVQHLPANLIEFPRELVATRKARPRLAEGPFYDASHANSQLSIFEVDPELLPSPVSLSGMPAEAVAPPEWASIELEDRDDVAESGYSAVAVGQQGYAEHAYATIPVVEDGYADLSELPGSAVEEMPVETVPADRVETGATQAWTSLPSEVSAPAAELLVAPVSDRLLAAIVDGALVTLAFVAAAVVVVASTEHPPTGRLALIASGFALLVFAMLYQFLFLSYAEEGTPGMRYARIALCTFDDDNPTLQQMRMRIPAMLFSALPAGLGLLWAAVDKEHLGWHDRMTRTYQRKY